MTLKSGFVIMKRLLGIVLVLAGTLISVQAKPPIPAGKANAIPTELPLPAKCVLILQQTDYSKLLESMKSMLSKSFGKDGEKFWTQLNEWDAGENRNLQWKGIAKGERMYAAITSYEFDRIDEIFFASIPVDDAKAFRDSFLPKDNVKATEKLNGFEKITTNDDDDFFWVEKKGRVFICGSDEVAKQLTGNFESFKTKDMGDSAEKFFAHDVGLYLNVTALREKYDEEIKQFRNLLPLIMQQGAGQVEKQQLDAAKAMFELLFQIIDDGSGLVVGLSLRPEGVAFSLHAAFTPKSPTAGITSKEKPSALADLYRMPKGLTVYTGSAMSANVSSWTAKFYREFAAGDNDEAAQKAFDRWQDLAKDTVSTITAGNTDRSGITIIENANATKCVSELMAALKLAGEGMKYQNVPIKGKPIIKENDQTHDGVSLNKITLNFDFDAMANSLPQATRDQQIASMKLLLPETLTIWTGAKGDRVLQVVGKDWAAAKASLDQLKGRELIADNAQAKATRENLPAEVGSLSLFEVAGLVKTASEYVRGVAGALPGIPFNPDNLKLGKIAGEATYIGAAFTLKGNTGAVDIYIPYLSIKQIYDVVKPAIESMKGDGP